MLQRGFAHILLVIIISLTVLVGAYFLIKSPKFSLKNNPLTAVTGQEGGPDQDVARQLSNGNCVGVEKRKLTTLPMKMEDFSMIIPYGLVVGDHVTPIDHQYFSPTVFHSPRDTYEVFAMADAKIVSIQPRVKPDYTEYRLVFSISCKLFYYYDLVTSLTPGIKEGMTVKAGQVIGKIGGQTLDFAVWDMDSTLPGFVVSEHYAGEPWKIHTVDPLDYYTDELKNQARSKYIRTVPPVSGKIDYDIDGKLVGNWFLQGSGGYRDFRSGPKMNYSRTHFAVVPNHLDPSVYIISFGDFAGEFKQFAKSKDAPDPAQVEPKTGLVKYELHPFAYFKEDKERWDSVSFAKGLTLDIGRSSNGCVLLQMLEARVLKLEAFPGTHCKSSSGFGGKAKLYER